MKQTVYAIHMFQEREKKKEEKKKQMEQLKEWSRPREDMECDDLKVKRYGDLILLH